MIVQQQPDNHTCLVTAFAMCMNVRVSDLIAKIGIDYKAKVFEGKHPERGINVQDVIRRMWSRFAITEIMDVEPFIDLKQGIPCMQAITQAMHDRVGVLGLRPKIKGKDFWGHTLAWSSSTGLIDPSIGRQIMPPDKTLQQLDTNQLIIRGYAYIPEVFWIVTSL